MARRGFLSRSGHGMLYLLLLLSFLSTGSEAGLITETSTSGCVSGTIPTGCGNLMVNLGARGTFTIVEDGNTVDFQTAKVQLDLNVRGGVELSALAVYVDLKGTAKLEAQVPHSMHSFPEIALFSLKDFVEDYITQSGIYQRVAGQFESGKAGRGRDLVNKIHKCDAILVKDRQSGHPTDPTVIREEIFKQGLVLGMNFGKEVRNAILAIFTGTEIYFTQYRDKCLQASGYETELAEIHAAEKADRGSGLGAKISSALHPESHNAQLATGHLRKVKSGRGGLGDIKALIKKSLPPATLDDLIHNAIKLSFYKVFLGSKQDASETLAGVFRHFGCTKHIPKPRRMNENFEGWMRYQAQLRICEFAKKGFAEESGTSANSDANLRKLVNQLMVLPHEFQDATHTSLRNASYDARVVESTESIDLTKGINTTDTYMETFGTASGKCVDDGRRLYDEYLQRLRDLASSVGDDAEKFGTLLRITDFESYAKE
jgi:hypothetical protein